MPTRLLLACTIFLALVACGKESLPEKPQIISDRDSIGFGQEFGSGTYVGTAPQESVMLENQGLATLMITSISIAGDKEFTIEAPAKMEVKGKDRTFIRIIFKPTAVKNYAATITVESNAENFPTKLITVTGRGIQPGTDGG